jgi:hypothetical protein
MNPNFFRVIALVLSGGLLGCQSTATRSQLAGEREQFASIYQDEKQPTAEPVTFLSYSNGDSPVTDGDVVTDLGGGTFIHAAADSWPALVAKVKPMFAWNGCDLLWIEPDTNGQPQFVLDEAYLYQPTNQPRQWVLLRSITPKMGPPEVRPEAPRFFYSRYNLFTVATLQKTVPHSDHGDNYAVAISTNRRQGVIYEIGWQREMSIGTAHPEYGRRIYLWKDRAAHWHFVGEGPEEGWARGGGQTVTSRVVWQDSKTNASPFQIRFHCEETTLPDNVSADDSNPSDPPYVTICTDYVLEGQLPAIRQPVGDHPYLLAQSRDTLEKIVFRLGFFLPGWGNGSDTARQQSEKQRVLTAWQTAILRLNPNLSQRGEITAGTRVELVNPGELINQLIESGR